MSTAVGRGADRGQRLKALYLGGGRQSIGHEVDADIGVARLDAARRVFGAVHVAEDGAADGDADGTTEINDSCILVESVSSDTRIFKIGAPL